MKIQKKTWEDIPYGKRWKILEKYGKIDYLVAHHSKSLSSVASSKWTKPTYPNEITRDITYLVSEMSHQVTKIMGESWENQRNPLQLNQLVGKMMGKSMNWWSLDPSWGSPMGLLWCTWHDLFLLGSHGRFPISLFMVFKWLSDIKCYDTKWI